MASKASPGVEHELAAQYARLLRLSVTSDWVCTERQRRQLRWAILARYRDLVDLGRKREADDLLAWRDAEKRAWVERNEPQAA